MSNKMIPAVIAALLLGSAVAWFWWPQNAPAPLPAAPDQGAVTPAPQNVIANPMPAAAVSDAPPLPALNDSDLPFLDAIEQLPGGGALRTALLPQALIRHIVATVDNLSRPRLAVELRPLHATPGQFLVTGDDQQGTLDDHNAARYGAATRLLGAIDMGAVNTLYQRYYPLFQRAYEDLGYPNAYFNDRLVSVIDHLLATPQPAGPIALVRPKVFWEYADPELESRSAGQKLLLRIGPDNAAVVRTKLKELRLLIASTPKQP